MDEYNEIVSKFNYLEINKISLATISGEYGFTSEKEGQKNNSVGERYKLLVASKQVGKYNMIVKIETRDIYRSFGDDDEPYINIIELWKNEGLVDSKSYTYFK